MIAQAAFAPPSRKPAAAPTDADLAIALRLAAAIARKVPTHRRDDARSQALLTWTELRDRHDPARGSMSTFAYPRMVGSTIDLVRRDGFAHNNARPVVSADLVASGSLTIKMALKQALVHAEPTLDALERTVLELVYGAGLNFAEASQQCNYTTDRLERANRRLIARLRQWMHVQVQVGSVPVT